MYEKCTTQASYRESPLLNAEYFLLSAYTCLMISTTLSECRRRGAGAGARGEERRGRIRRNLKRAILCNARDVHCLIQLPDGAPSLVNVVSW